MLKSWDNPTPMPCQSESMSAFASWHVIGCHRDAAWVVLAGDGETVSRFLCDGCRQNEGRPVPAIADIHAR